jgi:hypothetical protein
VAEKKAKKPARSIRYLLSADRRLHKLSLKKMAEPGDKSRQPRSNRRKGAAVATTSPTFSSVVGEWGLVLGALAVVAGAVMVAARQPSVPADVASVDAQPETFTPAPRPAMAARPDAVENRGMKSSAKPAAATAAPDPSTAATPAAAVQDANAASVTITGCLDRDAETFWLRDVSGAEAPKSRSWRSGFLKKRSSSIELVDERNALGLSRHVGERVAATGTLANREMQARSLTRLAASCK